MSLDPFLDLKYQLAPSMENEGDLFITEVLIFITPTKTHMANHDENYIKNTPNDLSSTQERP